MMINERECAKCKELVKACGVVKLRYRQPIPITTICPDCRDKLKQRHQRTTQSNDLFNEDYIDKH